MPAVRTTVLLGIAAAAVLVGVLVALVLLVADTATWSRPEAASPPGQTRACTNDDLRLDVDDVADQPGADRRVLALVWRNESATTCTVEGFPVVDLVGPATPRFGRSLWGSIVYVPRDAEARARTITLGPGETVRSVVSWAPPGARSAPPGAQVWTPDRMVVATPGERRNQSVAWPAGPILVGGEDDRGVVFGPLAAG